MKRDTFLNWNDSMILFCFFLTVRRIKIRFKFNEIQYNYFINVTYYDICVCYHFYCVNINNKSIKDSLLKDIKLQLTIKLESFTKFQHLLFYLVKLKNKIKIFDSWKQFINQKIPFRWKIMMPERDRNLSLN